MVHSTTVFDGVFGPDRLHDLAVILRESRDWHYREQQRSELHPAVIAACGLANPLNWHELVLQWPHKSVAGGVGRLAYTQDEKKGMANRQTVTSIGKYLVRHFKLPDHVIKELAHRYSVEGVLIQCTTEEMVYAVVNGPYSCMKWDEDDLERHNGRHPYEAYAPEYGWKIAVRMEDGRIIGRALLLEHGGYKCFVRTYLVPKNEAHYSERDEAMEAYLGELGYECGDEWPEGAKLAKVQGYHGHDILPYLDGDSKTVSDAGDYYVIDSEGAFKCDNTDGTATEVEREMCSCCGGSHSSRDDGIYVGRYDDDWVGPCCVGYYTLVTGWRQNEYYVPNVEAVEVDGDYYDEGYLAENGIVELGNGDYCKQDEAAA